MYHYYYDGKIFKTRFDVYDYIKYEKNGCLDSKLNLHFSFSDRKFNAYNWSISPEESLDDLYKKRALEIREKYDYVILHYTGGMDSHEVLNIFLKNNIQIDEIQTSHHENLVDIIGTETINSYRIGHLCEYNLSAKTKLKEISVKYPKIKITTLDVTSMLYNDNFAFTEFDGPGTHPYMFKLQKTDSYNLIQYNKTNVRSDRVCVIRGSDKPMVYVKNDKLLFAFNESVTHGGHLEYEKFGYKIENFFWSYESPLIPIKQSHIILDLIKNNESLKTRFKAGRVGEEYMRKHVCKYIYNHSHEIDFIANKNINTDKVNPDKTAYYLLKKNNNLNSAFYNRRKFYLENYKFLNGMDLVASKISYVIGEV